MGRGLRGGICNEVEAGEVMALIGGIKGAFRGACALASGFSGAVLGLAILVGSLWRFWLSAAALKYLWGW